MHKIGKCPGKNKISIKLSNLKGKEKNSTIKPNLHFYITLPS